jgi:elongation factor 1-beta
LAALNKSNLPSAFGGAAPKAAAPAPAAKAAAEEEDVDLFGDDSEEAAKKAAAAVAKPEEPKKKKEKVPEIAKTSVMYEVKTQEAGQDMKKLEDSLRAIIMDGLVWGSEFKVVDVAYGIQKLVVPCVIEDEKIGLEDLEERVLALEDQVQSIDLLNMSKVSGNA